jgi:AraC-like DNA-binding protein
LAGGVARLRSSRESLQSLLTLFGAAIRLTAAQPGIPIKTDGATRGLEQQLIQVLLGCLSTAAVQADEVAQQRHDTMGRLEDFLCGRHGEVLKVPGICKALEIPHRTLQACCLRQVGVSANRYFRLRAMRRVYDELVLAHPKATSISQVARRHGFTRSGWFAAAYRQQFGEYPSATLLREPGQPDT